MNRIAQRSLFLPDLLPCPASGRCDFHTSLFGHSDDRNEISKEWFCPNCQMKHQTSIAPSPFPPRDASSLSCLELLPTELLQHIAEHLSSSSQATLAFTSHTLCAKVGTKTWSIQGAERAQLVKLLAKDAQAYAMCRQCLILRPCHSTLAWPLLKAHRAGRGIPDSVYAVSDFLASKITDSVECQNNAVTCPSLLTCAGTYRKPWATPEIAFVRKAGFSEENINLGLAISYAASGRISKAKASDILLTHIEYRIRIPRSWTSFSIAERYTILRKFYLCQHTYASKVQYRDPCDPTYPSDSSIVHWLPHQGPMPVGLWMCSQCPTEFRSRAESEEDGKQHSIIFDVWRRSTRSCSDGMTEMTFCQTNNNHGSRIGRIREMFEAAKPI